jgi:manganese transport protein
MGVKLRRVGSSRAPAKISSGGSLPLGRRQQLGKGNLFGKSLTKAATQHRTRQINALARRRFDPPLARADPPQNDSPQSTRRPDTRPAANAGATLPQPLPLNRVDLPPQIPTLRIILIHRRSLLTVSIIEPQTKSAWRASRGEAALSDVYRSVRLGATPWKRFLAFLGPGYMVAVGYMDPGNWATSLAGGSKFGYALLFVALLSNLMAVVLQSLSARLAIGSGRDLAQACRDAFPRLVTIPLWLAAEVAIIATDVAEVIGTAIGLNLLFGIPLELGVLITALDVFLILWLQRRGFRKLEGFVVALLALIAVCFAVQLAMADPDWAAVLHGFAPTTEVLRNPDMLYIALGILGATVMPHNLYLHSAIVQTRDWGDRPEDKREALRFATIDSTIALTFALSINAAILILAAASFHAAGQTEITDLGDAHRLLGPLLGAGIAPMLFAVALLACGLNSTVTATLAGQAVMEGFLQIRLQPWLRRLITRSIAILPAAGVTIFYGAEGTGRLLILTQVVLSLQLSFAVIPLIMFTTSRARMGALVAPRWLAALAWLVAVVIVVLNLKLLSDFVLH